MRFLSRLLLVLPLAAALSARAQVETYRIDPVHTSIGFSIRHFVSRVQGSFTKVQGSITVDRSDMAKSSAEATIQAASVFTHVDRRDADLRSPHFFDAAVFPTLTFKSTSWKQTSENHYDVAGTLTIHGVTKPVVLKVECLGFGTGMRGMKLSGWHLTTTIDRRDFGISGYQGIVGNDVDISIDVEADLVK